MDPNDLIDAIVDAIDYAEIAHDVQGLNRARRLLNNELRQAIDVYVQRELEKSADAPSAGRLPAALHAKSSKPN
jgi:hypothetical protein